MGFSFAKADEKYKANFAQVARIYANLVFSK
ncbi:protein of unknown function [Lactobacillus delbrueckii subsp. delbrueckii]|uniref:Uncharacterized protein n=1 Tax=Lactobacillus delbrueckii subsp. delbrueckii TaxID=83684 RepID=A0AAU9R1Y0_9LACO|nr:protein of unknown function [Lactobacillus delbrueckii subsp. delbrueckii]